MQVLEETISTMICVVANGHETILNYIGYWLEKQTKVRHWELELRKEVHYDWWATLGQ